MACDLCSCEDHHHRPCPRCLNCTQHYDAVADPHEVHYDFSTELVVHHTKPRYKYNAKTGEVREVSAIVRDDDDDRDMVREAFGL